MRATRVSTARGDLDVLAAGDEGGPALLLLHPLASSGELWRPALAGLAERGVRAWAPTLPGPASVVRVTAPLSIASMAEDAGALIDALGVRDVAVLGMSMGGCIALELALQRPDVATRLVLVDTTASYGADRVEKWAERARAARRPLRQSLLPFQLDRWFGARFREEHADEVERVAGIFVRCSGAVHAACCEALGAFDVTARLAEIRARAMVVVGDEDYATPPAMSRTLAAGIRGAELHVLPGVRHMSLVESPGAWERVFAFVGRGAQPAASTNV